MQHVLRCWERQYDGSEYKKTVWRPGLRPGPRWGAYSAPTNPLAGGSWLAAPPQEPHPPDLDPSGLASPTPTPKLVPTPLRDH